MNRNILRQIVRYIDRLPQKKLERWKTVFEIMFFVFQIVQIILAVVVLIRRA